MSRQEWLIFIAHSFQSFQFTCTIHFTVCITSYIERYHAYRVARYKKLIALFVIKRKGEYSTKFLYKINSILAIHCEDNLAVTSGLELIFSGKISTYVAMIVDFTINSQNLFSVRREQWLSPTLRIDYRQTFVCQNGRTTAIYSAPVRSAVAYAFRHSESFLSQLRRLLFYIEDTCYTTHNS